MFKWGTLKEAMSADRGFKGALLPKLVAISIAILLLVLTLAFTGSSSSAHDATVFMVPVNSKAGENIWYTLNGENESAKVEYSPVEVLWSYFDDDEFFAVGISADGHYIAAGTKRGEVRLFGENDNTPLWTDTPGGEIRSIALSDNGDYIAVGTQFHVLLYDKDSSTPLWNDGAGVAREVSISDNGDYIAAATESDKQIRLYHRTSGTPVWSYTAGAKVRGAAVSGDGEYVVGGGEDYYVHLFGNENNTPIWTCKIGYKVYSTAINENGSYIVVGGQDNKLYLFGQEDNTPIWTYEHTDNTYHVERHMWYGTSISDNGDYIAASIDEQEGWYYLFSKDDNTPLWIYNEFGQEIRKVVISGDGSHIVGGGWGGRIFCFSNNDNDPLWYYPTHWRPDDVGISADGSVVVAVEDSYVHLLQSGFFAYELKTEGRANPRRVLTTTPEFSFKRPNDFSLAGFHIQVGTNAGDNSMWDDNEQTVGNENLIYVTYGGDGLSLYTIYYWRIRLRNNENNWGLWSVNKNFEIVSLNDFSYYRELSFTGAISDNYQIKVEIDNATNINENFKDLLFYDSDQPTVGLAYWVESYNMGDNATVWVRVHDNEAIKLHYSNENAEDASSGEDTFPDFFDNFSGTSLSNKWTWYGSPIVSGGELIVNSDYAWTKDSLGVNLALRVRANIQDTSYNTYIGFVKFEPVEGFTPSAHFWGTSGALYLRTGLAGFELRTTNSSFCDYLDKYTIYEDKRIGTDNVELWADDNLVLSSSTNIPYARMPIYLEAKTAGQTLKVDWVLLRKVTAIEPTTTIGSEIIWAPAPWQLIETWTITVKAPAWQLIETWTGTVETPPWTGTAVFSLVNLYAVSLEKDLQLYTGSKLVVKFYTYSDAFENENVIENFSPPWHVEENESARHPENIGVKKAMLVLTTDNTENVISTISSFVVRRDGLFGRAMDIKGLWPIASPDERDALFQEIMDIKGQWPYAPT